MRILVFPAQCWIIVIFLKEREKIWEKNCYYWLTCVSSKFLVWNPNLKHNIQNTNYFRIWQIVYIVPQNVTYSAIILHNINVFISFITVTLWQNAWDNTLDGRLIWGHGFRGFSPRFIGCNAFGPVKGEASWHGACGDTKLLTSWQPGSKGDGV